MDFFHENTLESQYKYNKMEKKTLNKKYEM